MRKQRQRDRRARSHEGAVESNGVENGSADDTEASVPAEDDVLESEIGSVSESATEPSHDLDSLGQEIERSLAGSRQADEAQPARSQSSAAAPPSRSATPEDILGLQTQLYEQVEESKPATDPEVPSSTRDSSAETGGSPPMENFEGRAAMAKEVLRATSDQTRKSRRMQKAETSDDSPPEETEAPTDENVRFSEDLTISAKKRQRRKLFGR